MDGGSFDLSMPFNVYIIQKSLFLSHCSTTSGNVPHGEIFSIETEIIRPAHCEAATTVTTSVTVVFFLAGAILQTSAVTRCNDER